MESPVETDKETFGAARIVIENLQGSYKSFVAEDESVADKYPLKGVTYPTAYGYIEGYQGEDGDDLDVFVGTGEIYGYIKVWRLDVPVETKIIARVTGGELASIREAFQPVIVEAAVLTKEECAAFIKRFQVPI